MLNDPFRQIRSFSFSREISIALIIKFLLLISLWWFFFAGKKQVIDETDIAGKIYGEVCSENINGKKHEETK